MAALEKRLETLRLDMRTKVTLGDQDKAEKKAALKTEEKFAELREQQRLDRADFNGKLATFKADVSLMTFDQETRSFLKNTIYPEWGGQVRRTKDLEAKLAKCETDITALRR